MNGLYACDSPAVLQTDLRKQLGFTGIILSDLLAAKTPQADLNAGMDWGHRRQQRQRRPRQRRPQADGQVSQATLDARVHEYLQTLFAYGFFDRAAYVSNPSATEPPASQAADIATEEGGATLLKNDGVLPLTGSHQKIAVIGAPAQDYVFGFGSSQVTGYGDKVTALQGIQARAAQAGDTVTYDDGTDIAQAEADAKAADVAVVVGADSETEGGDKQCMSLAPQCAPTEIRTITPDNPTQEQAAWGDQDTLIADGRRSQPAHRRPARDRRTGPHPLARQARRAARGLVSRRGRRHRHRPRPVRRRRRVRGGCPSPSPTPPARNPPPDPPRPTPAPPARPSPRPTPRPPSTRRPTPRASTPGTAGSTSTT